MTTTVNNLTEVKKDIIIPEYQSSGIMEAHYRANKERRRNVIDHCMVLLGSITVLGLFLEPVCLVLMYNHLSGIMTILTVLLAAIIVVLGTILLFNILDWMIEGDNRVNMHLKLDILAATR